MKRDGSIRRRIRKFREDHYPSQKAFADALGVGQTVVSAWERGDNVPSSEAWVKIASLARGPENLWFLKQAGLSREIIVAAAKASGEDILIRPKEGDMVLIPRVHLTLQGAEEAGPPVRFEPEFVPNPLATVCVSVDEDSSVIEDSPRGLVILDISYEGVENLHALWGHVVMLRYAPDDPESISPDRRGIYMGRLEPGFYSPHESEAIRFRGTLVRLVTTTHPFIHLGTYTETRESLEIALKKAASEKKRSDDFIGERARSEFRMLKGICILGKVIGRLTGHLKQ
jgi:transcriptional regulator with XRE-family HTH domain